MALGRQLLGGSILLGLGSLASAAAPASGCRCGRAGPRRCRHRDPHDRGHPRRGQWVPPERRAATLSWALLGQPAAWIVGLPLLGAAGSELALRLARLAARRRARRGGIPRPPQRRASAQTAPVRMRSALAARACRWLAAEVLTNTAWAGTLVYAGALFVDSYGVRGPHRRGACLRRRRIRFGQPRVTSFRRPRAQGTAGRARLARNGHRRVRRCPTSLVVSTALFAAAFAAGGRTLLSSASAWPHLRTSARPRLRCALPRCSSATSRARWQPVPPLPWAATRRSARRSVPSSSRRLWYSAGRLRMAMASSCRSHVVCGSPLPGRA